MIRPATTEDLDRLVNTPSIFHATGFPQGSVISMAKTYDDPHTKGFMSDVGGMVFNREEDGIYSGHFLFIPGSDGVAIKTAAKEMLNCMFTKHGASVIKGYPPRDNRAVRVIGTALGYRKIPDTTHIDEFDRVCETYEVRQKWLL